MLAPVCALFLAGCHPAVNEEAQFQTIQHQIEASDYQLARTSARQAWQLHPNTEWGWKFKAQYLLVAITTGDKAQAAALLREPLPPAFATLKPRYEYLRAYLALCQADFAAALKLSASALEMAKEQGDAALENEALVLESNLDESRRLALLKEALVISRQHHLPFQEASTLSNLGMAMLDADRYSDGIAYLAQGAGVAKRMQARFLEAYIRVNLSECYLRLGDLDQALRSFEDARAELRDGDPQSLRAGVNMGMGKIYSLRRENAQAVRYFRYAFAIVQSDSTLESYVPTAQKLASGLIEIHQPAEAERYNELALAAMKRNHVVEVYPAAFYTLNRADIASQRNQPAQAEAGYQDVLRMPARELSNVRWLAHARLAQMKAQSGDSAGAARHFESALSAIEENRSQQKATDQITFLSALIRFYQQYVDFLVSQGHQEQALAVADSSRASVLTRGLQSSRKEADFITRVRKEAREGNSALLFYWLAPRKSYLWMVTANSEPSTTQRARMRAAREESSSPALSAGRLTPRPSCAIFFEELPGEARITHDVQDYSKAIQSADEDLLSAPNAAGMGLYETLIRPIAQHLKKGMRVVVVPDGALHGLNFETLVVNDGKPHYWIDDVSVTVAPSLRILLDRSKAVRNSSKALVIGDGDYSAAQDKYPPLPESKKEVAGVSALFPTVSTVLTQGQAVPEAYARAQPALFSVIHFSAHVAANENSPLDSAIILSPGESGRRELYARDLMKNPLQADLVTISGCNSVGKKVLSGEGMVGFAWAAFAAGARNAVTSLWEVDDRSTTELMESFYSEVTQGKPYAAALRDAKLKMLKGNFKKPYYWAPFQLYSRNLSDNGRQ